MALLIGILLFFFLTLVPYSVYHSGQLHYFLYAFHRLNPGFLSRDWLVTQTANPHPFFSFFIAWLHASGNLPLSLFIVHLLQFLGLVTGIVLLCRVFTRDLRLPLLVSCLLLFYFSEGLGQSTLYSGIVQPEDLGKLFYLFSLVALFRERLLTTFFFLGLAGLLDVLTGIGGMILWGIFWVVRGRPWSLKRIGAGFLIYLFFFSPNLIPILKNFSFQGGPASAEVSKLLYNFRGPHHYRFPCFELSYVFRVFFTAFFLWIGRNQMLGQRCARPAFLYGAALFLLCLLSVLSIEWLYLPAILQFRFFRLSPALLLLGLVFLSLSLLKAIDQKERWGWALAGVTLSLLFLEKDSRLFIPLSMLLVLQWALWFQAKEKRLKSWQMVLIFFTLILVPAGGYAIVGRSGELLLDLFLGAFLVGALKTLKADRALSRTLMILLVLGVPALALHHCFPSRISFHPLEVSPPSAKAQENLPLQETFDWIRTRTPRESLLLTPPAVDGFRFFSERAIVVDFQANPYRPNEVKEWKGRLETVTQTKELETWRPTAENIHLRKALLRDGYLNLTVSQIEEIVKRYGVDYFVTEAGAPQKGPLLRRGYSLVFENSAYLIFQMRPSP